MDAKEKEKIFNEGYKGCLIGSQNPYSIFDEKFIIWNEGKNLAIKDLHVIIAGLNSSD